MTQSTRVLEYFATLVAEDEGLPLTETALALAQDAYPDLDLQTTLADIDALVERLKKRLPKDAANAQKLPLLNRFFFGELGFAGNLNDYYDPDNSHLNVVLRKRRGIPISLAVLYLEVAQQIQLPVAGVSFPGHFMVRVTLPAGEVILDPVTGETLTQSRLLDLLEPYVSPHGAGDVDAAQRAQSTLQALLQPATSREIIARMLRNLKIVYTQTERWQRLLGVQQRLAILLPQNIEERRDRGLAFARLDYLRPAIADLEAYLHERPEADDATVLELQLTDLRQRAKQQNDEV